MARRIGEKLPAREGKNVYPCILSHVRPAGLEDEPVFMVVVVIGAACSLTTITTTASLTTTTQVSHKKKQESNR